MSESNPQELRQTLSAEDLFDFSYIDPQGRRHNLTAVYRATIPGFLNAIRDDGRLVCIHSSTLNYESKNGTNKRTTENQPIAEGSAGPAPRPV